MAYYSTKTYGHNIGLSAVFRQPDADHSHCHLLHGYSLQFKFTFGCNKLDNKNWAVDFGGLKPLKKWLEDNFDHKTAIDRHDPYLYKFAELENMGLCEVVVMDGVGAEKFAEHAWRFADKLVREMSVDRCWCESVECSEHGANSAIYTPFTIQKTSYIDG
jgi:6-pyruvoyltetrahydropterin/6-carboxytetrahydropterin synthase|tara:strand:- start:912 stop:1391 length:480 start_codon:yes stop_codon:yes gene_type:complete